MGSITFLNGTGDITIAWEEENNEKMLAVIEKKMAEGVTFFIVEEFKGREWTSKIKGIDEITGTEVRIQDKDMEVMFQTGLVKVGKNVAGEIDTVKKAETPAEVAKSNTVAVKPIRGG
jgi:hypothetical protein